MERERERHTHTNHGCQMAIARFLDCMCLALLDYGSATLRCQICHLATLTQITEEEGRTTGEYLVVLEEGFYDAQFLILVTFTYPNCSALLQMGIWIVVSDLFDIFHHRVDCPPFTYSTFRPII